MKKYVWLVSILIAYNLEATHTNTVRPEEGSRPVVRVISALAQNPIAQSVAVAGLGIGGLVSEH